MTTTQPTPMLVDFLSESAETRFLQAAKWGTIDKVKAAVAEGACLTAYSIATEVTHDALLRAATSNEDPAVVQYLLDLGLDRFDRSHLDQDLVATLAKRGWVKLLESVIQRGTNPDTAGAHGVTALMAAAWARQAESVQVLLQNGARTDVRSEIGATALHRAGSAEVVEILLDAGADIEARNDGGRTPIFSALHLHEEALFAPLMSRGANLEARDVDGCTPLIVAADNTNQASIRFVLDAGAAIDAVDNAGRSALNVAAGNNFAESLALLIGRGADLELADTDGHTALLNAARCGHKSALIQLLDAGADREAKNLEGQGIIDLIQAHPEARGVFEAWCARFAMRSTLRMTKNCVGTHP